MTRKSLCAIPFLAVVACERSPVEPSALSQPITPRFVSIEATSKDPRTFWRSKADSTLWSDISLGGIAIVGLRSPAAERGVDMGRVVVSTADQLRAHSAISNLPGLTIIEVDKKLPILRVRVRDLTALRLLRNLPQIDYIEPEIVPPKTFSFMSVGCGGGSFSGQSYQLPQGDIFGVNYNKDPQWIPAAWSMSSSAGSGITVGLVDTGIDPSQPQLGGQFADGMSNGRSITSTTRIGSSASDDCGHGTHMAGVIAAPRDGRNVVGVAWRANLFSVKVNGNPYLSFGDVNATRLGIGDAASVSQIIVMAFGTNDAYSSIQDEIGYWYYNFDRLFVGAGGNFPDPCYPFGSCQPGVLFPARLGTVFAITAHGCPNYCIKGPEIDFQMWSDNPSTGAIALGHPDVGESGVSSGATAVFAGIAALVWSTNPTWTRAQVMNKIISCSHERADYAGIGWGTPNAMCAVSPAATITLYGPAYLFPSGEYPGPYYGTGNYTATPHTGQSPFTYEWTVNGEPTCGSSATCQIAFLAEFNYDWSGPIYTHYNVDVAVTDATGMRFGTRRETWVNCVYPDGTPCPP